MLWNRQKKPVLPTHVVGDIGEQLAADYLTTQGLTLLDTKFHCRLGEIDLVMKDQSTIVFIEVKYRKNSLFGGAISAVSPKKQQKIIKTALFYLQHRGLKEYNTPCRFDVVAILGNFNYPDISWLKNAFTETN